MRILKNWVISEIHNAYWYFNETTFPYRDLKTKILEIVKFLESLQRILAIMLAYKVYLLAIYSQYY